MCSMCRGDRATKKRKYMKDTERADEEYGPGR